ncbi:MAG: ROK family protein [Planctomycetota bacterium]
MESHLAIAVDVGGMHISAALLDLKGKLTHKVRLPSRPHQTSPVIINGIKKAAKQVLKTSGRSISEIIGIGIGCPGSIDERGIALAATPHISGWRGTRLKQEIGKEFGLPVSVDNDANLAALGEKYFGAGRKVKSLVCFTLGTGVGGGVIINGRIHRGSFSYAGEVGHLVIKGNNLRCHCGQTGCLETLAGAAGVVRRATVALENYISKCHCDPDPPQADYRGKQSRKKNSLIFKMARGNLKNITAKMIFDAARRGDRLAKTVVQETGWYLGAAVSQVINILDPELIVLGGAMAQAGEILFRPIRQVAFAHIIPSPVRRVKIVPAQLGENAGLYGAATLVFQQNGYNCVL